MTLAEDGSSSLLTFSSRNLQKLGTRLTANTIDHRQRDSHSGGQQPSWPTAGEPTSSGSSSMLEPRHYPASEDHYHEPNGWQTRGSDVHLIDELDFQLDSYGPPPGSSRGGRRPGQRHHRHDTLTNDLHCDESSRLSLRSSQQQASSFVYQDDDDDDDQYEGGDHDGRSFASLALARQHQRADPHMSLPFEQQHRPQQSYQHQFYHNQYQAHQYPNQSQSQRQHHNQPAYYQPQRAYYQQPPTSFSSKSPRREPSHHRKSASSLGKRRQSASSEQATESQTSTSPSAASQYTHHARQFPVGGNQLSSAAHRDTLPGGGRIIGADHRYFPGHTNRHSGEESGSLVEGAEDLADQRTHQQPKRGDPPFGEDPPNSRSAGKRRPLNVTGNKMVDSIHSSGHRRSDRSSQRLSFCGKFAKLLLFVANISFWVSITDRPRNACILNIISPLELPLALGVSCRSLRRTNIICLNCCATILVGFCGCSAILKNNRWILGFYIFLILAIFALDLATGLLAIIFQERLVANMRLRLTSKLRSDYGLQASFTAAMDYIQTKYQCCGLEGHFDYDQSNWRLQRLGGFDATVARTCCHLRNTLDDQAHINPRPMNESMCQSSDVRFHQSYRYRKGCLDDLELLVRHKIWTFTVGCGLAGAAILLSLLFATCFCRSIPVPSSPKTSSGSQKSNASNRSHNKQNIQQLAQAQQSHGSKTNNFHHQARQHNR